MKVSPQTQTVYFLDIYQVEVSKDKSIYVNRCKKQVRGSDGRLERSPFVNAKKTSLVLPVKLGQYGRVRWLKHRGLAPFHNETSFSSHLFLFPPTSTERSTMLSARITKASE